MDLQSMFKDESATCNTNRDVLTHQMNYLHTRLS